MDYSFEIAKVYQEEAELLLKAREKSKVLHVSGNIDASGDEIEIPVRDFLKRRLPAKYYVGHGHIVDKNLSVSPQLDVIVADNSATPILFEGENGTQYFPYESVYLFGEIRSTYVRAKKPISKFSNTVAQIAQDLTRDKTPTNYFAGFSLGGGLGAEYKFSYRNPLFAFMLFVNTGDLDIADLAQQYCSVPAQSLPNAVCFLDGSIIVKAEVRDAEGAYHLGPINMSSHHIATRDDLYWQKIDFLEQEYRSGRALSLLVLGLFEHLRTTTLMEPKLGDYLNKMLKETGRLDAKVLEGGRLAKSRKP